MVKARIQDINRLIETTLNKSAVYSPVSDSAKYIGKKAAAVVNDEVRSGTRSSAADSTAAARGFFPSDRLTIIDSDITIALSTRSPSEIIRAARDTVLRLIPKKFIAAKDARITVGIKLDTRRPVRNPRVMNMTIETISTA